MTKQELIAAFATAKKEFSSITAPSGIEVAMTQNAYADNHGTDGGVRYYADGVDVFGNTYRIAWDTTQAWDDANERIHAALRNGEEPDFIDEGMMQDESNACEWDDPVSVVMTDTAE